MSSKKEKFCRNQTKLKTNKTLHLEKSPNPTFSISRERAKVGVKNLTNSKSKKSFKTLPPHLTGEDKGGGE
jgi:hypothetical protein